ncbi:major facilitator superfamily domain-containing protein [Lipomyces kononenkoae]|uniref:Major facilitator superfamily domain-containing protein n=1 Tax=Lipomyces kononenkoae TaxID=34357 RepID=A0ACC3T0X9_LIPKO
MLLGVMKVLSTLFPTSKEKPYMLKVRASGWMIMTTVAVAVFTDIFMYGIIIPIIPNVLVDRLEVPPSRVQNDISLALLVYAAGLLVASPIFGALADIYQNRRLFMIIGLVASLGSTIMLCLARVLWVFILGRLIQGISGAAVWTVGLALITDSFPEENIGKMMGILSSCMSLAVFLGPLIGGVVYSRAGYYALFGILFGLICTDLFLRVFMLERKDLEKWKPIVEEERALERNTGSPSSDGVTTGNDATPYSSTAPRKKVPKSKPQSLVGLKLLKNGRMVNGLYIGVIIAWIFTALEAMLPLHVETIFHWSTLGSGLVFLPIALTSLISPLIGFWIDRRGPRWPLAVGLLIACPIFVLLRLPENSSIGDIVLLFALLTLLGLSSCMLLPSSMAEISTCVTAAERKKPGVFGKGGAYGLAFGLFNLAYSAGSVFGPLFVTGTKGWGTATWALGLICFVSAIPAILFTGGFLFKIRQSTRAEVHDANSTTGPETEESRCMSSRADEIVLSI